MEQTKETIYEYCLSKDNTHIVKNLYHADVRYNSNECITYHFCKIVGIKTKQRETKFVSARELNVVVSNRIYSLEDNLPKFANMIFAKYEESLQKEQKRLESKKSIYENLKQAIQELGEN